MPGNLLERSRLDHRSDCVRAEPLPIFTLRYQVSIQSPRSSSCESELPRRGPRGPYLGGGGVKKACCQSLLALETQSQAPVSCSPPSAVRWTVLFCRALFRRVVHQPQFLENVSISTNHGQSIGTNPEDLPSLSLSL